MSYGDPLPRVTDSQPANVPVRGVGSRAFDVRETLTFAEGRRFAPGTRGNREHVLDALHPLVDGFFRSACRLDRHGLKMIAFDHSIFFFHAVDLEYLATEPDHQCGPEIRMGRVAHCVRRNRSQPSP